MKSGQNFLSSFKISHEKPLRDLRIQEDLVKIQIKDKTCM